MIEIWLLFHIVIPFLIYFILFWQEHTDPSKICSSSKSLTSRNGKKEMEYLEIFSRFYLPCSISMFVVIFFLVCFAKYYFQNLFKLLAIQLLILTLNLSDFHLIRDLTICTSIHKTLSNTNRMVHFKCTHICPSCNQ